MAAPKKTAKAKLVNPVPAAIPAPAERSEAKGSGSIKPRAADPVTTVRTITHDAIARRAYEIYASRGYAAGSPDADWREAERQLRAGL